MILLFAPFTAGLLIQDAFRGTPEAVRESNDAIFPIFYPPAIWHQPQNGDEPVMINQVGACMIYLGEKLGYNPKTAQERARADCVLLNAIDYIGEGRKFLYHLVLVNEVLIITFNATIAKFCQVRRFIQ